MSQTVPNARLTDIVRQIRGAVLPFLGTDATVKEAREASTSALAAHTNGREEIMISLARISMDNQLTANEVRAAAATAAGQSAKIEAEKSLATFIGQAKLAMSPKVRSHMGSLVHIRDLTWNAEELALQEDKDAPKPLRKAFARKYHCLFAIMKAAEEGRVIDSPLELVEFAYDRDPDLDIDKVQKRLKSIMALLSAFHVDWPVDDIQLCVETLSEVTDKKLKASRVNAEPRERLHSPIPSTTHMDENTEDESDALAEDESEETKEEDVLTLMDA